MRARILHVARILMEETDEEHPLTVRQIGDILAGERMPAERKAIYRDIAALKTFGWDILSTRGPTAAYCLAGREFETVEVRMLVDAVLAARFITKKKTAELIEKLKKLASRHQVEQIGRQVVSREMLDTLNKAGNELIYYTIDNVQRAIGACRKIRFQYSEYDAGMKCVLRKNGRYYSVSPYSLVWSMEYYYMIGNTDNHDNLAHYRIDRMHGAEVVDEPARSFEEVCEYRGVFNTADYMKQVFSMFTGTPERVRIRFEKRLINPVMDRFRECDSIIGVNAKFAMSGDDHFIVDTEVIPGDGFLSWLLQFWDGAELLSPLSLRREIAERMKKVGEVYRDRS